MENKKTTLELLAELQKENLFTDAQKAEILGRIIDEMPEEDIQPMLDLFKKY